MVVKNADDLKNPSIAFSTMIKYAVEAEEDFVDYNETIVSGWPFCMWLLGKGYINSNQVEDLVNHSIDGMPTIQEILFGDILFPKTNGQGTLSRIKAYTLLAEYMSMFSVFRNALYNAISDGSDKFEGGFYKNEDGISLACIIDDDDLKSSEWKIKAVKEGKSQFQTMSLRETYIYISTLSMDEADS